MESRLPIALEQMRKAYGRLEPAEPPGRWTTLVRVVLGQIDATVQAHRVSERLLDSVLASPSEVINAEDETIAAALARLERTSGKAGVLRTLARWWLDQFGDVDDVGLWDASTKQLRDELVGLPGVSLELADRLLLFVGDQPIYPISRPSVRICCRHGWMVPEAEYEEWQSFLVGSFDGETQRLREFWLLVARIGRHHCGRVASCDGCPLQSLLPPTGPYEPESA